MAHYLVNVRDANSPSSIIGQLTVPYIAHIGQLDYVRLYGTCSPNGEYTAREFKIHKFILDGYGNSELCFKLTQEELAEVYEWLGID
jgi:hypothetical protein